MKKSLFLLALPALILLSGCNNSGSTMGKATKVFTEDCLAHEEIFGKASEVKFLAPTKKGASVAPSESRVGVQSYSDENYYYVRYVAEVSGAEELDIFRWNVNVYSSVNGNTLKDEYVKTPSGFYTEVSNGDDVWTAPSGSGLFVFTLLNIPKDYAADYLTADIYLENSIGTHESDTYVTSINEETQFRLDRGASGYFGVVRKSDGSFEKVDADNNNGGNHAQFEDHTFNLNEGESFLIINKRNNTTKGLQVYGYNNALQDKQRFYHDNQSNFIRSNFNGNFKVYLNGKDEIWINSDGNLTKDIYINPNKNIEWLQSNNYLALYTFNKANSNALGWYKFAYDSHSGYYKTTVSVSYANLLGVIFARMNNSYSEPSWGDGHVFNQTDDLDLDTYIPSNLYTPESWGDGEGAKTSGRRSIYQA